VCAVAVTADVVALLAVPAEVADPVEAEAGPTCAGAELVLLNSGPFGAVSSEPGAG